MGSPPESRRVDRKCVRPCSPPSISPSLGWNARKRSSGHLIKYNGGGACCKLAKLRAWFYAHGIAPTRAFVPHIDAALVVIGADPPISGDEVVLIEQVAQHVHALIFVLSKADRLTDTERREAIAFARKVLAQRLGKLIGPIFEVSATERLSSGDPSRDWPGLEAALATLAATSGVELVRQAERRGSELLAQRLLHDLDARALQSRCRLEAEIRGSLRAMCASAERALERARSRQAAGAQAVQAEVARLDSIRQRVEPLRVE